MNGSKKFAFDVSITFLSSIANVLIGLPISIVLGRYLGAGDLGLYRMVSSIYGIAMIFVAIGVPAAMIKYVSEAQEDRTKVNSIISSGIFISFVLGCISFITFLIFSNTFGNLFDMGDLPKLIVCVSFAFPFSIASTTLLAILNGFRKMKKHAIATLFQTFLMLCSTLLFVYLGYGVLGAVMGIVVSSLGSCIYLAKNLSQYFVKISISEFIHNSKTILSFGSRTLIANSINLVNYQADTLMVGYFLTKADVGFYSVAVAFAKLLWIIPDSIQKITYPMISELNGKNETEAITQVVMKTMRFTACISILVGTLMLIYAEPVITLLYGTSFAESVTPFHILIIGTMIFSVVKSINSLFASVGRVDLFAKIPTFSATINVILNLLLIPIYGISGAALATSTSLFFYVLTMLYYMKKLLGIVPEFHWYAKAGTLWLVLIFINNILLSFVPVYVSGVVTILFGISLIWMLLLSPIDREYFLEISAVSTFSSR